MKKSEWAPGVYEEFMESYDFVTCVRADGSYYGNGGVNCKKGSPATKKDLAKEKKKAKAGDKQAAKNVAKMEKSGVAAPTNKDKAKDMAATARKEAGAETGKESLRGRFNDSKKVLGEGSYGEVRETASGTVIKKGMIGPKEVEIQQRLNGVAGVPKVIEVQYSSKPFKDRGGDRMGIIEMEKASGKSLMEQQFKLDNNLKGPTATKIGDQYIKLRKELHMRGVAHGDMHEGNLTWDGKKLGVLDFGLSKTGSKAALQEALGTKGNDVRAAGVLDGLRRDGGTSGKAQTQFSKNLVKIEKKLGIYDEYGPNPGAVTAKLNKMSDKKAQSLLEELYDGV